MLTKAKCVEMKTLNKHLDTIGLTSPVTETTRILIQKFWSMKFGWET